MISPGSTPYRLTGRPNDAVVRPGISWTEAMLTKKIRPPAWSPAGGQRVPAAVLTQSYAQVGLRGMSRGASTTESYCWGLDRSP